MVTSFAGRYFCLVAVEAPRSDPEIAVLTDHLEYLASLAVEFGVSTTLPRDPLVAAIVGRSFDLKRAEWVDGAQRVTVKQCTRGGRRSGDHNDHDSRCLPLHDFGHDLGHVDHNTRFVQILAAATWLRGNQLRRVADCCDGQDVVAS